MKPAALLFALLLVGFWASRLIGLGAFPPFIDEMTHLDYANDARQTGLLAHAEEGRQLVLWWFIALDAPPLGVWAARAGAALAALVNAAAVIGIGALAGGRLGGVLAGIIVLFSPYHLFFDRLALADAISGAGTMCAVYFALRLSRRSDWRDAALCGLALFGAVGAKVSALPYFSIPVFAALLFNQGSVTARLRWLVVALLVGGGLTAGFLGLIALRGYNPFFYLGSGTATFVGNIGFSLTIAGEYLGWLTVLALALLALYPRQAWRPHLYLLFSLFAPLIALYFSSRLDSRHLFAPMSLLLVSAAVGLAHIPLDARLRLGVIAVWGALVGLPFAWTAAHSPADLPLPAVDRDEYMLSDASGFGLAEVVGVLQTHQATHVIGLLSNCYGLRAVAPPEIQVTCPRINPNGSTRAALGELLTEQPSGTFAVLERSPFLPDTAPGELVIVIEHPAGRVPLAIYRLAQGDDA